VKKTNSGCYVVDHAIEDPDWGIEYAEKFCMGDCDSCRHWYADRFLSDGGESFKMELRYKLGMDNGLVTHNDKYTQKEVLS